MGDDGAPPVTDDVETPTVVETSDAGPPSSGNGLGGTGGGGEDEGAAGRSEGRPKRNRNRTILEWGILIVVAVVIAIVIKTFLFQAFYIPSESMVPALEVGDRVLVNKLSYDLHDLNRGDIVVFEAEPNVEWHHAGIADLVKRVIALPGETVTQCETTRVCIDGRVLNESYLPEGTVTTMPSNLPYITNAQGKKVLVCEADSPQGGCTVPPGKVFVMGDNRTNSQDARANGPIKESSIVGRVFLRIWPPGRIGFM
jgi:signal peptidase I